MKSGYIYVLTHPSDPTLYKIGITIRDPKVRLAEHNNNPNKAAGRIVKETGFKWELKEFHLVPDPYFAENAFWASTPFADIPYQDGIEIERMTWEQVQKGLAVAIGVGIRPEPEPLPDWVYAYTASVRKRLQGRGISLTGYVKSLSGKNTFRCTNGHEWRTMPKLVSEGQGCPKCGQGERSLAEIRKAVGAGVICLLTHPDMKGYIKVGTAYGTIPEICIDYPWGEWEIHRHRNVEDARLAESIFLGLLGQPPAYESEPIPKDLKEAEEAMRNLTYALQEEIAFEGRRLESRLRRRQGAFSSHTS